MIGLLWCNLAGAQATNQPFIYYQDFEETDPVVFFTSNGKYTVNFKGLTQEKAFSGKRSFKLDVTIHSGYYCYWQIPLRIPLEGQLKFTARVLVGAETTARGAGLGLNVFYMPLAQSGCGDFDIYGPTNTQWNLVEKDLASAGRQWAANAAKPLWGVTTDNISVYADRIIIFLKGNAGQRVVVYIDDIKLEGTVPTDEALLQKTKWAPAQAAFDKKIQSWKDVLAQNETILTSLACNYGDREQDKKNALTITAALKTKAGVIEKKGVLSIAEEKEMETSLAQLTMMCKLLEP